MRYEQIKQNYGLVDSCPVETLCHEIKNICAPLEDIGIHNLSFVEYSADRTEFIALTSQPNFPKMYLKKEGFIIFLLLLKKILPVFLKKINYCYGD